MAGSGKGLQVDLRPGWAYLLQFVLWISSQSPAERRMAENLTLLLKATSQENVKSTEATVPSLRNSNVTFSPHILYQFSSQEDVTAQTGKRLSLYQGENQSL